MANIKSLRDFSLKIPYFNDRYTPLSEHADILRAPLFKDQPGQSGVPYKIVSIKDFPSAGYLPVPQRDVMLTDQAEKANSYTVRPHDVLVTIVGSIGHVSIVPEEAADNWVPATNIFVVRFQDDTARRSRALYALLKSVAGQSVLDTLAHGRGIQIVSKKQFSGVLIPEMNEEMFQRTESLWNEHIRLHREGLRLLDESQRVYSVLDDIHATERAIS